MNGAVGITNSSIAVEVKIEIGFKGNGSNGVWIDPVLAADALPLAIEVPGMESVSSSVSPQNGIGAIDVGSGKSFIAAMAGCRDLFSVFCNGNRATTVYGDGIEASA